MNEVAFPEVTIYLVKTWFFIVLFQMTNTVYSFDFSTDAHHSYFAQTLGSTNVLISTYMTIMYLNNDTTVQLLRDLSDCDQLN